VVVGAGLVGGVIARKLAEESNKRVLIIERRNHLAGNIFDFHDEHNILIQKYGPHIFHTNSDEVNLYLKRYCEPQKYITKCEAVIDTISTPSPFNFKTIDQFYSKKEAINLKTKVNDYYEGRSSVTVLEMLQSTDRDIRGFAEFLFEKDYKLYTAKQWGLSPEEIDPSILERVPVLLSYRDTYFNDKYEFVPRGGYTEMYNKIVNHSNISVELGTNAISRMTIDNNRKTILFDGNSVKIVFTGAIDELFNFRFGVLPYRSLYFKHYSLNTDSFQNVSVVAYPQAKDYTRITEYTKLPIQNGYGWTNIAYEYPVKYDFNNEECNEPFYPVLTSDSKNLYVKYKNYANSFSNLYLCGRLADFKYYNMDQAIISAFKLCELLK
jgi:UDP-galactopyranose mutase